MKEGWDATGLLAPLWVKLGGRDALAEQTGIQPGTLSGYNTGRLPLGMTNARKIAAALEVSVLELGAPAATPDVRGRNLVGRLEGLEADLVALTRRVDRLARQVTRLARAAQPETGASRNRR